jgi:hypothetical protein
MGFPTKVQLIKRKESEQWYINFPSAIAQATHTSELDAIAAHPPSKLAIAAERTSGRAVVDLPPSENVSLHSCKMLSQFPGDRAVPASNARSCPECPDGRAGAAKEYASGPYRLALN